MQNEQATPASDRAGRFRSRAWRYRLPVFIGVSLGGAALADYLFYQQWVGWTLGAYLAAVLGVVACRHGKAILRGPSAKAGLAVSLLTAGLAVSLVMEPGKLAFVLSMLAIATLVMIGRGAWADRGLGWRWLGGFFAVWLRTVTQPILDSKIVRRWEARAAGKMNFALRWAWMIAGLVIPLALCLVFIGLFALANPVVSKWVGDWSEQIGDIVVNLTDYLTFGRLFLWYITGFGLYGLLRYRHRKVRGKRRTVGAAAGSPNPATVVHSFAAKKQAQAAETELGTEPVGPQAQGPAANPAGRKSVELSGWLAGKFRDLIVRCLIGMNLIFAVQIVLDGRYLVLGSELPEGMSYAQYAHRGAYPLLVTALLAAALVLAVFRPGGIAQRSTLARRLVLLWIAQNVVLMVTAVWRLGMYVEVYSLTRMRVAAGIWMLLVAGCLLLVFWRIGKARDNRWLTGRAMGWGLAVLYLCCFVPFDPLIAGYNVDRCKELGGSAGPIDVAYLEMLGPDALPAIDRLLAELPAPIGAVPSEFEPETNLLNDIKADSRAASYDHAASDRIAGPRKIDDHYDPTQSLRNQLVDTRERLLATLDQQLDNWRGWTARRAWLRSVSGPGQPVVAVEVE